MFLRVVHKSYQDDNIIGGKPRRNLLEQLRYFVRTRFRKYFPRKPFASENRVLHSQALYDSGLGREVNRMRPDVIMLGWLGGSTLSIKEIAKLRAPVVWRLSDMWLFSGAEHYSDSGRYERSYSRASRPPCETGPDINRETFIRKQKSWRKPQHIICPSNWIAGEVKKSALTSDWPVHVIPNPLDFARWKPSDRDRSRLALGLPPTGKMIVFGAGSGLKDRHKGGDLFLDSLRVLSDKLGPSDPVPTAAIFGEDGEGFCVGNIKVVFLGRLDDEGLRFAYSAANVIVVPSRVDNLPSTAVEAQACGRPVVAFRTGGLPDIVVHGQTGLLVEPFDINEMAVAIQRLVDTPRLEQAMGRAARKRAEVIWSPQNIAQQYLDVFERVAAS